MIPYYISARDSVGKRNNTIGMYGEHFIDSKCCPKCNGKIILVDEPSIDFRCIKCNKNYEVKCIKKNILLESKNINSDVLSIRCGKFEKLITALYQKHIDIILITYNIIRRKMVMINTYQIKNVFLTNHSKIIKLKNGASIIKINVQYLTQLYL